MTDVNQNHSGEGRESTVTPTTAITKDNSLSAAPSREEWLASLKVGDEVARKMSGGWGSHVYADFMPVSRLTAKYIVLGSQKFRKEDGREMGNKYGGYILVQPTDKLKAAIADQSRKIELMRLVDKIRWRELPVSTLEAVIALANGQDTNIAASASTTDQDSVKG